MDKQINARSHRALTVLELLVAVAVVATVLAVFLPVFARTHARSARAGCPNNLKQIGLAFLTWEGDYGDRYPMSVPMSEGGSMGSIDAFLSFKVMSNEINNPRIVICPADQRPAVADFGVLSNASVSYFVGLDADEFFPNRVLSGDRNLMTNGVAVGTGLVVIASNQPVTWSKQMHNLAGNIGLADGSVQQVNSKTLKSLLANTALRTNRLALP